MDANEQITRYQDFFQTHYETKLANHVQQERHAIIVDFSTLAQHDVELAEHTLVDPENFLKAAEIAIEQFDFGKENTVKRVRIKNLPNSQSLYIANIRSKNLDHFITIEGIVRQASEVRPQVTSAKFECPSCGQTMAVLQLEAKFREPTRCSCGRKGKFRLLSKELVDAQHLKIEESPENLQGGEQPKRLSIFLREDLVDPRMEKRTTPGSKVRITGTVKEIPIMLKTGAQSIRYDIVMEANHIESVQEDFDDLILTREDEEEIETFAKDDRAFEKISKAIAPSIYGYKKIKEALVLQLFGGARKVKKDGTIRRGDIHILLVGDPGCGKCLDGETKIMLNDGNIIKIKELAKDKDFSNKNNDLLENITLPSLNFNGKFGKKNAIRVWAREEKEKLLEIKLRSGKILRVTKNHPLFFSNEGYIVAKEAKEFKIKEKIATPRRIEVEARIQTVDPFTPILKTNAKKNQYPEIVDKNLARFCGYLCGDGRIAYTKTSGWVAITNNDEEILKDFKKNAQYLFNRVPFTRQKNKTTAKDLIISSKHLVTYFKEVFPKLVKKANEKDIPDKILKSPNFILAEFLSALFECDSHINRTKKQIEYCTISKELAEHMQLSLLRFGIVSFLKTKVKYAANTEKKRKINAYEIVISGTFVEEYAKKIGYISTRKKEELKKIIISSPIRNTNIDIIPGINQLLKRIRKEKNLLQTEMGIPRPTYAHFEQNNRSPSRTTLQKIVAHLKEKKIDSEEIQKLSQLAHAEIFWDEIKEIKKYKQKDSLVYDLEVDTTHNYIANGVVVHNSQLLQFIAKAAPKARFVSGKGASGAGLTASVVRDEFLRGWSLEAGAMVLANKGIICCDELDKMSHEDRSALHEALESQTVTISKANIQATLRAETTMLAAANPKLSRFDPFTPIANQIDLPSTLINRFDLIFPIRDLPDKVRDEKIATHVLEKTETDELYDTEVSKDFLRKYLAYARTKIQPKLSKGAIKEIRDFYVTLRNSTQSEDGGLKPIPISARQLEALVRLSEAHAKIRLDETVSKKDATQAIELLKSFMMEVNYDHETGTFDIDRGATGMTTATRNKIIVVRTLINELEASGLKQIPIEEIISGAMQKGIDEDKVEEALDKLKRSGDIFEPKKGYIQKI